MLITQLIITQIIIIIIVMAHHHGSIPTRTMTHHFFFLSCGQQPPPHITQVTTKHAKTHSLSFGFFLLPSMSPRIHIHSSGMPTIQDDSGSPRSHYSSRQVDRPIIYSCTFFFLLLLVLLLLLLLLLHLSCRGLSQ